MISNEVGYIFLYVAAFGFSDYFVQINKLTGTSYLLYYTLVGLLAVSILYYNNYQETHQNRF